MGVLANGYKTLVSFGVIPGAPKYGEIELTPIGIAGRGGINQDTMRNAFDWVTQLPKRLKQLSPLTFKASFDTDFVPQVFAAALLNGPVTLVWPDLASILFWGWIDEATFDPHNEENRPTINVTVQPSNINNLCVITPPVFSAGQTTLCSTVS